MTLKEIGLKKLDKAIEKEVADEKIKEFVREALKTAPDYFFKVAQSLKDNNNNTSVFRNEGGLVNHVLLAVFIAKRLFRTYNLTVQEQDIVLAALFLHDMFKYGYEYDAEYYPVHALLHKGKLIGSIEWRTIDNETYARIISCIETHMGPISDRFWIDVVKPGNLKPESNLQQIVHISDTVASFYPYIKEDLNSILEEFEQSL